MQNNKQEGKKIYGMLLEVGENFFLSIQCASTLEEAFQQAKLEFNRLNSISPMNENSIINAKIGLFCSKTITEIIHEGKIFTDKKIEMIAKKHFDSERNEAIKEKRKKVEIKKIEFNKEDIKNHVMEEILKRKDKKMLEKNKSILNDNEIQYLTDRLNGDN